MGAGIVPVAVCNGEVLFLFGREVGDGRWSDFGGGAENNESQFKTAIREGCEELSGFFGCESSLKKLVTDNLITHIDVEQYRTYLFQISYDENLPEYFNNNHRFISKHLRHEVNQGGLFEKSQIKWFSVADMQAARRTFRPFYRTVLDRLIAIGSHIA